MTRYLIPFLAVALVSCAGYTPGGSVFFDADGDPSTPPTEVTQAQRCAIYDMRIAEIDAKPGPMSDYDTAARAGHMRLRTLAFCPLPAAE